jgi:hypothetical protein
MLAIIAAVLVVLWLLRISRISCFVMAHPPSAHLRSDFSHCAFLPWQT